MKSEQEEAAKNDLRDILADMSLGEAFPDEGVQTSGTMGKTRKRNNKKQR